MIDWSIDWRKSFYFQEIKKEIIKEKAGVKEELSA